MGSVNITLANGGLGGTLQTNDGIVGMVLTGGIDGTGDYVLGTPILLTSFTGLAAAGITTDGNEFAVRQVQEFYDAAGDGAQLYLMLVENSMTVNMMADKDLATGAVALLEYAQGAIKVLGVMSDDLSVGDTVVDAGLNELVYTAAAEMELLANVYVARQQPFRGIVAGTSYNGVPADLTNMTTGTTNNRCAILIGDTVVGDDDTDTCAACLGLLLGSIAAIPVMRKISRVRNGSLPITAAYMGLETVETVGTNMPVIAGKGFITFTTYPNVSGYYFSGDPMLTATTDDYAMLARGRVIDKAHILAYTTFVQEVDDEVPINTDGTLDAGYCKHLEQQIVNQINNTMTGNQEISSVRCFIDPAQNVLSTNEVAVVLRIIPVGYATEINISLGFQNPANS